MTGAVHRFADVHVTGAGTVGLDPDGHPVADDELAAAITVRGARPLARAARLALAASLRALADEQRLPDEPDPRAAVVLGTRGASLLPLAEFAHVADAQGPTRVFPMSFPNTVASVHAGYLCTLLRRSGPVLTLCGPGAGLEALLEAALIVATGAADDVLAVETDEAVPGLVDGVGEGAAAVRLGRGAGWAPGAGGEASPRHPPLLRVRSIATGGGPDELRLGPDGPGAAPTLQGGLSDVARLAAAGLPGRLTVTGRLGVRGSAAVLLEPGPPGVDAQPRRRPSVR